MTDMRDLSAIAAFVRFHREQLGLTQSSLADSVGEGIHIIRKLEQGKRSLRFDKVENVLTFFGYSLAPVPSGIDPFKTWYSFQDKAVEILLKDKQRTSGFLVGYTRNDRGMIDGWKLVPVPEITLWLKRKKTSLVILNHNSIEEINLMKHEEIR